ncbi:hypothetical protein C8J57DRAFT_1462268 [Mycena rebaudengoi]|nr:hypothetical protein C8J57DRAFT_1462268 [Mycena rebaudengoi]
MEWDSGRKMLVGGGKFLQFFESAPRENNTARDVVSNMVLRILLFRANDLYDEPISNTILQGSTFRARTFVIYVPEDGTNFTVREVIPRHYERCIRAREGAIGCEMKVDQMAPHTYRTSRENVPKYPRCPPRRSCGLRSRISRTHLSLKANADFICRIEIAFDVFAEVVLSISDRSEVPHTDVFPLHADHGDRKSADKYALNVLRDTSTVGR